MSLYNKTKEEIVDYLEKYYKISNNTKQIIINEFIDGEVLFEFNEEDFEQLELLPFALITLKNDIKNEKNKNKIIKESSKEKILKKFISFGIEEPFEYIEYKSNNSDLKIGQKKLIKKYSNHFNAEEININSSGTEVLFHLKNKIKISQDSLKQLIGITGRYFFEMDDEKIDALDIAIDDKNKLKNLLKMTKNNNNILENKEKEIIIGKELLEIEKKMKLEEMIITDSGITMKLLYQKLEENKEIILKKNKEEKLSISNLFELILTESVIAKIYAINWDISFNFLVDNLDMKNILLRPISAKIEFNNELLDIDIISNNQIDYIVKDKGFNRPICSCKKCQKESSLYFIQIIDHSDCKDILLYDGIKFLEYNNEIEFNNFFQIKDKINFSSPLEFERNFNEYFNRKKLIKTTKEFIYYEDIENRNYFQIFFKTDNYFGQYLSFFGFPGIGKSITILHILKYEIEHDKIKTLYIHCKYLSLLSKENNYLEIQRVLLSEIPFLFYKDFSGYKKCCNIIKDFKFNLNNTFYELIEKILNNLANKNTKYIIVFDQHNAFSDPLQKIQDIVDKILSNEEISKNFLFFSFMSLNNEDVKDVKAKYLLGAKLNEKYPIYEIKNLICDKNFSNLKKQRVYEKLRKNIRNYNELFEIDVKKLNNYYKEKKNYIKKKLIEYYNKDYKDNNLSFKGIENLMQISVDISYEEKDIKKLIPFIHFKYFDIKKNEDYFEIFYTSPIVEEVLKEIYYSFVYDNQNLYEKMLTFDLIKGGGKGCCFEQIVVHNLSPSDSNYNVTFPDLIIEEKKSIPQFIPKSNEVNIPYFEDKIKIKKNKTYLIEQDIFGGKSIDFIIIDTFRKEQIIFAFQASILKDYIFTESEIKEYLKEMNAYIINFIDDLKVDEKNLFFGYVFSLINDGKKEFKYMIKTCKSNKIPYSFYSFKKKKFLDGNKKEILSIYDIVNNPFGIKPITSVEKYIFGFKRYNSVTKIPSFEISEEIKNKLVSILKDIYSNKVIEDFNFQENLMKEQIWHYLYDFYYSKDNKGNPFIFIIRENKIEIYNLYEVKKEELLDYIFNNRYSLDCYFIKFKGEEKKTPHYLQREKEEKEFLENLPKINQFEKQEFFEYKPIPNNDNNLKK